MSINAQKLADGLTKIVWKTVAPNSLKDDRRCVSTWFKLDRNHLDTANGIQLRIENFEENDSNTEQEAVRFYFTLKLITPGGNLTDDDRLNPDSECQPCSTLPKVVWVSINEGNIQTAKNKKNEKWCTWQSLMYSSTAVYDQEITCRIWIQFNETTTKAPSQSETNALQQFTNLYVRQSNCDVYFCFEDGQRVGGHATILAARSLVFASLIQHAKQGKIVIQDTKSDIFKDLLYFVYSGRVLTPINEVNAQPLLKAADEFDIEDLKKLCVSFLMEHIQMANVYQLISWAKLYSVDDLFEAAVNFHNKKLIKLFPKLSALASRRITMTMSLAVSNM